MSTIKTGKEFLYKNYEIGMMKKRDVYILFLVLLIIGSSACNRISEGSKKAAEKISETTTAVYETTPVKARNNADAADDPAIWKNRQNPAESRIIGTDKKGGLGVYDLQGQELFYYEDGRMNNVDVRYDFPLGHDTIDIVLASNRSKNSIAVYKINPDGSLQNFAVRDITSNMIDVYGFCLYESPVSGKFYAFVNSKTGDIEQWELFPSDQKIDARLVRELQLNGQVEGMVADDENQVVFIGEESNGIWRFEAEPNGSKQGTQLKESTEKANENIRYDIEGLAFYYRPDGCGYLVASSQGNYSFAVFERQEPHRYLGSFKVTEGQVDAVEETDGIEIYSFPLNEDFQHGLVIMQDGYNYEGEKVKPQNFKLVRWEDIAQLFSPTLEIN